MAAAATLSAALACALPAAAQVPPDADWRTVTSEHFRVTFPAELEALGRETAARAEVAWRGLSDLLVAPPSGRTEILLTDHVDASNGYASVAPYPRIVLYARPPVDGFSLSYYDDWIELVVTHELAHVFHLDVSGPLGHVLRTVFGRVPSAWPFFPNEGVPAWTREGLAVWYESALTGSGRLHGTYHDMVVRTAVLEGRFEDVGQASGDSPVWPEGDRPYIYGSLFFEYLLRTRGPERMGAFVEAVGDQLVPYRLNAAARDAFGVSFSDAWEAWHRQVEADATRLRAELARRAPLTEAQRLTRQGRFELYPALDPTGRLLAWSRADGRSDPQLRLAAPDGTDDRDLTRTNGSATLSWTPDGHIVFAQLELSDPYRMRSDLYLADRDGGVRRVTRGARVEQPSVTPDGEAAVVIETGEGTTRLAEVDLGTGRLRPLGPFDPEVHWAWPAVSPDGRRIAASRWTAPGRFDVVVLDRQGRVVTQVTDDRALDLAPAWSPDGRWLVWSSDRSGIANLMAARIDPESARVQEVRQVTNVLTGAFFPSVGPAGRWIHFSVYHADGFEVARIPFDPSTWLEPFPLAATFADEGRDGAAAPRAAGTVEPYSPFSTLRPRYWEPTFRESVTSSGREVVGGSFGAFTSASDLVGRHALDLEVLVSPSDGRTAGGVAYRYAGLGNPVLSLSAAQSWDAGGPLFGSRADGVVERLWFAERDRSLDAAVTFLHPRYRRSMSLRVGGGLVEEDRTLLDDDLEPSGTFRLRRPRSRLSSLQVSAAFSTVRSHAFSVGPERGVSLSVLGRTRRELDIPDSLRSVVGRDRSTNEVVGRILLFRDLPGPGYAHHVLALRASGGAAEGPGADQFHYDVGGASGFREPFTGFSLFGGRSFFFPARGFANGERVGRFAWSVSAEYRFPLALMNRGVGLLPLHFDRVSGAVFFDAANAWGPELGLSGYQNPRQDPLTSAGAEVLARLYTFFSTPVVLRGGVAWRLDGGGAGWYVRLGPSF